MTIFAVMCALIFPGIHVGRVWVAYFMFPIPNQMGMWPNFRSPLLWDVFAVSIYGSVSALFWYVGLIPDLATIRDRREDALRQRSTASSPWDGAGRTGTGSTTRSPTSSLAGLATPLVLSVHSIVSMDFAVSQIPGWHTTIFPPYFVAGAIFSGFAMVITLMVICRSAFGLKDIITLRHFDYMAKIILVTGTMVGYAYGMEFFIAWYSGNPYEMFTFTNRAMGPYAWAYWTMITCNVISPQVFWFKKARTSIPILFVMSIFVNIGMWFERFVIIVTSLHRDFLPSSWSYFRPTIWDVSCLLGASVCSSRCSVCSCGSSRWWRPPRSRRCCRRPIRTRIHARAHARPRASRRRGRALMAALRRPRRVHVAGRPLRRVRARARCRITRAGTRIRRFPCTAWTARWDERSQPPVDRARFGARRRGHRFLLQTWVHNMAYPLTISGKPTSRGRRTSRSPSSSACWAGRSRRSSGCSASTSFRGIIIRCFRVAIRAVLRRQFLHLDRIGGPEVRRPATPRCFSRRGGPRRDRGGCSLSHDAPRGGFAPERVTIPQGHPLARFR
jgi:Ni/Fe-hydrogenase subunit HybB-like protein